MIQFAYTILYVSDVTESVAFYERAFGCVKKFITLEGDYGELETGSTTLAFAAHSMATYNGITIEKTDKDSLPPACEIAFVTDDINQSYKQAIGAGATSVTEPIQKPWGQTVAYVRDMNGFLVELCTAIHT